MFFFVFKERRTVRGGEGGCGSSFSQRTSPQGNKKVRWNDRVFCFLGCGGCGGGGWGEEWGCRGGRWVGGVGPQGNKSGVPLSCTFVLILNASM